MIPIIINIYYNAIISLFSIVSSYNNAIGFKSFKNFLCILVNKSIKFKVIQIKNEMKKIWLACLVIIVFAPPLFEFRKSGNLVDICALYMRV